MAARKPQEINPVVIFESKAATNKTVPDGERIRVSMRTVLRVTMAKYVYTLLSIV
jgi:hypothetical protein